MRTPVCPNCKTSDLLSIQGTVLVRYPLLEIGKEGDDKLGYREEVDGTFELDELSYYCANCSTAFEDCSQF